MIKANTYKRIFILACAICTLTSLYANKTVISNATDLANLIFQQKGMDQHFDLLAVVVHPATQKSTLLVVKDKTGSVALNLGPNPANAALSSGDLIRIKGTIQRQANGTVFADCTPPEIISHGQPVMPKDISPDSIATGEHQGELVRISGTVLDVFCDEIDPKYMVMILNCDGRRVYATSSPGAISSFDTLIGADISVTGICLSYRRGGRQFIGFRISVHGKSGIQILSTQSDFFDIPELGDCSNLSPTEISMLGRRRISGRVLAAYDRRFVLIKTADRKIIRAQLAKGNLPRPGDCIQLAGFPECDLFRINLSHAKWRKIDSSNDNDNTAERTSIKALQTDLHGKLKFDHEKHGSTISVKGTIISLPDIATNNGRFYIKDGTFVVPVNVSSVPNLVNSLQIGAVIEATGICVMESENWRPNHIFPQITGLMVVVRTPDDIKILSYPPWWTAGRLFAVIGALLTLLSGIFIWNRMLNRLAEQRGRELADEKIAHVTSDLKVYERTRLAVELHDSLSQNLTGVSLAIRAANRLADTDHEGMQQSLNVAAKALDSCRDELRNCLWDLRNLTLEETDMNEAVRQTLAPHVGDTKLFIRFNVSRERLSDNTAHSILRMIRELASNAVRHGGASTIKIAGAIENDRLIFSVSDDGSGFDPENRPNASGGHFGLQGVQDRVDGFEGEMYIKSAPGSGTKITISIKAVST